MKTLFLVIFYFISLHNSLWSQATFLDSTYVWTEKCYGGFIWTNWTTRFTFSPVPHLNNGYTYYERLMSFSENGNDWQSTFLYYRIDDSSRVYINDHDYYEKIIYDYNLEVNDSFQVDIGPYLVVDFIDSITLENGERRKRLALRCSFDDDPLHGWGYNYWIEGLGSSRGVEDAYPAEDCFADGSICYTLCMSRNDTLLYDSPDFDSCWYITVPVIEIESETFNLFPNPTKDVVTINGDVEFSEIIIRHSTGEFIAKQEGNMINLSNQPQGIYLVELTSKRTNRHYFQRVIKL